MSEGFEIAPGSSESHLLIHIPHSSRSIPADVRDGIVLDDVALEAELDEATDSLTDALAFRALEHVMGPRPTLFINRTSRFVIDPERFPDEREAMNKIGMGAVYLKAPSGARLREESFDHTVLLDRYFHPYAKAFTELTDEIVERHGQVAIIDLHSYRANQHVNAINHGQRRPAMCVGTDRFHTPSALRDLFFDEFGKIGDCFENEPYAGTYVPLKHYGRDPRVLSVMMETRGDTYLDDAFMPHSGFDQVAGALARVLNRINAGEVLP